MRDPYMDKIIESIIATVRFGNPKHLRNDLNAILELYLEYYKETENNDK
jgi:hypothetical protein